MSIKVIKKIIKKSKKNIINFYYKLLVLFCYINPLKWLLINYGIYSHFNIYKQDEKNIFFYKYPEKVKLLLKESYFLKSSSPVFNSVYNNLTLLEHNSDVNILEINNTEIISGSNIVIINNKEIIYDCKSIDNKNIRYTDAGIINSFKNIFLLKKYDIKKKFDSAIYIGGNFSWNFYHFLFENLSKFVLIEKADIDSDVPLLFDMSSRNISQFHELINLFNYSGREIIFIEEGFKYKIKKLFYIQTPNIIPPNFKNINIIKGTDIYFSFESLEYIRKKLLSAVNKKKYPNRIFLMRKNASKRRSFNEEEVFNKLKGYGFTAVYPEEYSIKDQITMFNNAEVIAGGTGAAFTNIICCNSSCKVIIFAKDETPFSGFSILGKFVGLNLYYISEHNKKIKMKNLHEKFNLNIETLVSFMDQILIN